MKNMRCTVLLALGVSWSASAGKVINEWLPLDLPPVETCYEFVVFDPGLLHLRLNATASPSGNTHLSLHFQTQAEGVGETSGAMYQWRGDATIVLNETAADRDGLSASICWHSRLISQGPIPNQKIRLLFHLTVNAQGETTVQVVKAETICD